MLKNANGCRSFRVVPKPQSWVTSRLPAQMMRIMRLLTLFIFITTLSVAASSNAQNVTLSGNDLSLEKVFSAIEKQTGYVVFFSLGLLRDTKPITIDIKDVPLDKVLNIILEDQLITARVAGKTIFLSPKVDLIQDFPTSIATFQDRVRVHVLDQDNNVLSGATVTNKKTKRSEFTDEHGWVSIVAGSGDVIEVTYVGFNAHSFTVKENNKEFNIQLKANGVLEEAVVYNGYQKIQQKYMTGSVTSLKMDSIIQPGFSTVDMMLEGRVPGLTFMQNSGQSGAAPKLRIRGTSTLLGSREPLWVVDGIMRTDPISIPASQANDPDFVNLVGNAISGLSPLDIERIDVLKDATAAALYGLRGANGVIVITTKRGKSGPPILNYSVTGTFTPRPRYTDNDVYMMNSRERVDVSREMIGKQMTLRGEVLEAYEKAIVEYYAGRIDYATYKQQISLAETINTDWFKAITRDVIGSQHSLSLSGGSPAATYRASIGYTSEPGVIKNEYNNRYTSMLNVTLNNKKFQAKFDIQLSKEARHYNPSEVRALNYAYSSSRAIPLYNDDGSLYYYSTMGTGIFDYEHKQIRSFNIINEMNRTGQSIIINSHIATANFNYEITDGIQLNTTLSYGGSNASQRTWFEEKTEWAKRVRQIAWNPATGSYMQQYDPLPFGGELQQNNAAKMNYTIITQLNFRRFIGSSKKHFLGGVIGGQINSIGAIANEQAQRGYYPDRGKSFTTIDINTYPSWGKWLELQGGSRIIEELNNTARLFINTSYIFNDQYVFDATIGSDYSNSFGTRSNARFLPTWSLSGKWMMYKDLLKNVQWIDIAELTISHGTVGNLLNGLTPNAIIQKGSLNNYYGEFGSMVSQFPNPSLGWEVKRDYNSRLDFSIFSGKVRGFVGYFVSRTTNAFLNRSVSMINGVTNYTVNEGALENRGLELGLQFTPADSRTRNGKHGFVWQIDPQLGQVFNKLLDRSLKTQNVLSDPNSVTYNDFLNGMVPINGKSVNTFYSYRFKGLDSKDGVPMFYGAEPEQALELAQKYNNMSREDVYRAVMVESGRREPVLQGGISNYLGYKNWSLRFMINYSFGNKIRLLQIASGDYGTFRPSSQQNLRREFINRWRVPGDELITNIPGVQGSNWIQDDSKKQAGWWRSGDPDYLLNYNFASDYYQMYDFSDLRVVRGDYIKLQQTSIMYRLSEEQCNRWRIKGATVNLSGSNLFVITNKELRGQDHSQSGSAPNINLAVRPNYSFTINLSL